MIPGANIVALNFPRGCRWGFPAVQIAMVCMLLTSGLFPARAQPPIQYLDVSASAGIGPFTMAPGQGGGIAAVDYDKDGDIDVFVPTAVGVPNQFYRNLGNGQFEDIASQVGLASTEESRCALWFDYDADHDWDLLVANDVHNHPTAFRLYRQHTPLVFTDVTQEAGLYEPSVGSFSQHRGGMCAGDLNHDGWLDVFCPQWDGPSHLFLNNRDGTFTDVSGSSGIDQGAGFAHQAMMVDLNRDGWLDMYLSIDFVANILWQNLYHTNFVDVAASAGLANQMNDMGMTIGDYDNDGDFDIYTTNIYRTSPLFQHNTLFRNDSTPTQLEFSEVAADLDVDYGGYGWGTTFADADNDGWLDLAATNGFGENFDPSAFYWNQGGGPFLDVSSDVQFNDTHWGSALISFDYDRDGDLDLMQACMNGPLRLLSNQPVGPGPGNFLVVQPRMNGANHFAIGAVVRIEVGSISMMRLITAGTSYQGQEPAEAFFGVGNAETVDRVIIEWPNATTTELTDVAANTVLNVNAGDRQVPALAPMGLATLTSVMVLVGAVLLRRRAIVT